MKRIPYAIILVGGQVGNGLYLSFTHTACFNACNLSINELEIGYFQEEVMSF